MGELHDESVCTNAAAFIHRSTLFLLSPNWIRSVHFTDCLPCFVHSPIIPGRALSAASAPSESSRPGQRMWSECGRLYTARGAACMHLFVTPDVGRSICGGPVVVRCSVSKFIIIIIIAAAAQEATSFHPEKRSASALCSPVKVRVVQRRRWRRSSRLVNEVKNNASPSQWMTMASAEGRGTVVDVAARGGALRERGSGCCCLCCQHCCRCVRASPFSCTSRRRHASLGSPIPSSISPSATSPPPMGAIEEVPEPSRNSSSADRKLSRSLVLSSAPLHEHSARSPLEEPRPFLTSKWLS